MKLGGFAIILIFKTLICFSQTWTDPVNVSRNGSNHSQGFTFDKYGVIHCVWVKWIDPYSYYSKIYYSKSIDDGLTWFDPVPITTNSDLWLADPHIVSDTFGNLYVSYDYDVGTWPDSKICYVKYNANDSTWSQQNEIATGWVNKIVITQNNRVYFFWFAGTEYYMYLENNIFSDTLSPSSWIQVDCSFDGILVDNQNTIHSIGNRQIGSYARGSYFSCANGIWNEYLDLSEESCLEGRISLNSMEDPSFIWRQRIPSSSGLQGTYYSKLTDDSIQIPVLISQRTSSLAFTLDYTDRPHIVEVQSIDSGYQLVHRFLINDNWQTEILDQTKIWYIQNILISKNSCLYLIYNKVDSTIAFPPEAHNAAILFRKLELPPGIMDNSQKTEFILYPNPFSDKAIIEIQSSGSDTIRLKIFDIHGRTILQDKSLTKLSGTNRFIWEGEDDAGKQVENGYYFIQLSEGSNQVVKKYPSDRILRTGSDPFPHQDS
jgi:hypothetical protein